MLDGNNKTCPSGRAKPGAGLLGVRQEDGSIAILPQVLPVDNDFIRIGKQDEVPLEERFRFSNKCVESGCIQWTGSSCRVASDVLSYLDQVKSERGLLACGIRSTCRWFHQEGEKACKICIYVVTEIPEEDLKD